MLEEPIRKKDHAEEAPHDEELERIVSPAVWYKGKAYLGPDHKTARLIIGGLHPEFNQGPQNYKNGFKTTQRKWVSRKEGLSVALAAGQVKETDIRSATERGELYSQDLQNLATDDTV
jgi:hypothetical protein